MHVIAYTSRYSGDGHRLNEDLAEIVQSSQKNNPDRGVTGVMFYQNGRFLQLLEGEKPVLDDLMAIIKADTRHSNIDYLFDDPVNRRGLIDWNMDCFNLHESNTISERLLKEISEGYRATFEIDTNILLSIFRSFIDGEPA